MPLDIRIRIAVVVNCEHLAEAEANYNLQDLFRALSNQIPKTLLNDALVFQQDAITRFSLNWSEYNTIKV